MDPENSSLKIVSILSAVEIIKTSLVGGKTWCSTLIKWRESVMRLGDKKSRVMRDLRGIVLLLGFAAIHTRGLWKIECVDVRIMYRNCTSEKQHSIPCSRAYPFYYFFCCCFKHKNIVQPASPALFKLKNSS